MYRHVHIWQLGTLRKLDQWISDLSKARGIDIWRWVRTFFTDHRSQGSRFDNVHMTTLKKTVNLIEADLNIPVSSQLLATLRQCCPLLRSLDFRVDDESHEAMAQLRLFEHVKHLGISRSPHNRRPGPSENEPVNQLADVPSWNMPAVTHFSWRDRLFHPLHEATFVSRCRFPYLQHLDISILNSLHILDGMPCICRFLDAHQTIRSFRIRALPEEHMVMIPAVRARNLLIRCDPLCPPRAWVPLLRPEVKTLELELSSFLLMHSVDQRLAVSLWDLLAQCAVDDGTQRPATLEKIHLRSEESAYDDEDHDITTVEGFSSTLRSHIHPLKARGIRVFVDGCEICDSD
jgi:hypothetical protein